VGRGGDETEVGRGRDITEVFTMEGGRQHCG
jgi:hypothetical protein